MVDRAQRWTQDRRCPICKGADRDPRGKGKRCTGYMGTDGKYAHCSREELSGGLPVEAEGSYAHKLHGSCKCGVSHGPAAYTNGASHRPSIVATYDYVDENGDLSFQVVKRSDKSFLQRRPDGAGGWEWKTAGMRMLLYRLPELLAADPSKAVTIVEGEKDVDTLHAMGMLATTNPRGAGKWGAVAEHAADVLRGRKCLVVADNDEPGRAHAREVAESLRNVAASVRVMRCPKLKDVTDHLQAGGTLTQLVDLERDDDRVDVEVDDGWPEPDHFDSLKLPDFPVDALSPWMRDWAKAESVAMQAPVDLPACVALGAASLACARSFWVQVRAGWAEPTNTWIIVALPPGERKSPIFNDATGPIYAFEKTEHDRLAPQIAATAFERSALEGELKSAVASAVKGKKIGGIEARQHASELRDRMTRLDTVKAPVLVTDDCTAEALAVLLSEHDERMGIFSAEGGPLEMMAGRYSERSSNFEIYLKAHNGDHHIVHRISREPIALTRPLLTMALTVQPGVIEGLSGKEGFRGRGLLARFLYSMPRTSLGSRASDAEPMSQAVLESYTWSLYQMLKKPCVRRHLTMHPEAGRLRSNFQRILEPRLGPDGDLYVIGDWANKLVGTVCRIAGILHVTDHAQTEVPEIIPLETMIRAVSLGEYFLAHSVGAFDVMRIDDSQQLARRIWAWIERKSVRVFTSTEALKAVRADAASTALALAQLIDRALIRPGPEAAPTGGRPAAPCYEVLPPRPLGALDE